MVLSRVELFTRWRQLQADAAHLSRMADALAGYVQNGPEFDSPLAPVEFVAEAERQLAQFDANVRAHRDAVWELMGATYERLRADSSA